MPPEATAHWAESGAALLLSSFASYDTRFRGITARARQHFERADWSAAQGDSMRRLDVYGECVAEALGQLRARLGALTEDRELWAAMRAAFARRLQARGDGELAETFYNSCVRRAFHTVGVNPDVEFVALHGPQPPEPPSFALVERFTRVDRLDQLVRQVLDRHTFAVAWDDAEGDARRVASAIVAEADVRRIRAVEMARPVFFRGKGAYLVGRLITDGEPIPLLLALRNPSGRVVVDAALLSEDEVSIVFSFARAYFFVDHAPPRQVVDYLRALMPRKPVSELYTSIGFHRHGKTELYRSLLRHLATSDDQFEIAPGQRGMVMCVFMLPGFDVVFKVIRDRFDPPKTATREEVREKYRLVFRHDRAGRLVDAMEFEHLEFARARFAPELLEQLLRLAGDTVRAEGDTVVVRQLYTERRLRPLDLYLGEADPGAAREAVQDYGQVLRDLATTNIFPGDMLLKNFGVSRHGRLIFYDYDELVPLAECRFREMPRPSSDDDDVAGEPWYYVGERDIFPEEFRTFLGLRGELLEVFLAHHEELLGVAFWHRMQAVHRRGEVLDIYPYRASRRLRRGAADPDATKRPEPRPGASPMSVTQGEPIVQKDGRMIVPDHPVIPFIEGDGTGPDIWRASVRVLDAAVAAAYGGARRIMWHEVLAGQKAFDQTGNWLPDVTLEAFRTYLVGIKGPLTTPIGGGIRSLNVAMRQILDLYVCLRPVRWFQGVPSPVKAPEKVDMVIFRENTEDIYAGIEFQEGTPDAAKVLAFLEKEFPSNFKKIRFPASTAIGWKPVSREGSERLIRAAIEYALTQKRKSVTLVHKGNIMKFTEGAFRNWGYALAEREFGSRVYTWEQWERTKAAQGEEAANAEQKSALAAGRVLVKDAIADITLQQVLTRPDEFDVIATLNLNGDYLSDALAAQVGGIGIAPGGNINYVTGHAVFEATHGTAPKYANQDRVNPGSVILSGEMMLRYMNWNEAADRVLRGMDGAIGARTVTYDFARQMQGATEVKCSAFADAIIAHMK